MGDVQGGALCAVIDRHIEVRLERRAHLGKGASLLFVLVRKIIPSHNHLHALVVLPIGTAIIKAFSELRGVKFRVSD